MIKFAFLLSLFYISSVVIGIGVDEMILTSNKTKGCILMLFGSGFSSCLGLSLANIFYQYYRWTKEKTQ